jgi:predicted anti-sigma-YlaC factor YlaD
VKKVFNKPNIQMGCRKFEARLEDYLGGAPDSELSDHLTRCADCRSALENSRLAGDLLREAWEPASEPSQAFLANVMARIRQEEARAKSPAAFWAPFEFLASRLSLTAAVLLLALSVYLVEFTPRRIAPPDSIRTELSASDLPQPPGDPVSNEEVLQSLAERNNER